jgi:hypothetical protein
MRIKEVRRNTLKFVDKSIVLKYTLSEEDIYYA